MRGNDEKYHLGREAFTNIYLQEVISSNGYYCTFQVKIFLIISIWHSESANINNKFLLCKQTGKMIAWTLQINRLANIWINITNHDSRAGYLFIGKIRNQQTNSTIRCDKEYPSFFWLVWWNLFLFAWTHKRSPKSETPWPFKRKTWNMK